MESIERNRLIFFNEGSTSLALANEDIEQRQCALGRCNGSLTVLVLWLYQYVLNLVVPILQGALLPLEEKNYSLLLPFNARQSYANFLPKTLKHGATSEQIPGRIQKTDTYDMVVNRVCHGPPLIIPSRYCFFKTDLLDSFLALFQLSCSIWIIWADFFNLGKDCFLI